MLFNPWLMTCLLKYIEEYLFITSSVFIDTCSKILCTMQLPLALTLNKNMKWNFFMIPVTTAVMIHLMIPLNYSIKLILQFALRFCLQFHMWFWLRQLTSETMYPSLNKYVQVHSSWYLDVIPNLFPSLSMIPFYHSMLSTTSASSFSM